MFAKQPRGQISTSRSKGHRSQMQSMNNELPLLVSYGEAVVLRAGEAPAYSAQVHSQFHLCNSEGNKQ